MTSEWRVIALTLALTMPGLGMASAESCKGNAPQEALRLKAWQRDCLSALSTQDLSTQLFDLQAAPAQAQPLRRVLFEELRNRDALNYSTWGSLLAGHISAGDWKAAAEVLADPAAAKALGQRRLPKQVTGDPALAGRASGWLLDHEHESLRQEALAIERGPRVIFQIGVGCGFCERAIQAIHADERLSRLFKSCGAYTMGVDGNFDLADIARWQDKQRLPRLLLVTDWSWLAEGAPRSFPQFLFLQDGQLREKVVGWPKEGQTHELLQALKKIDPAGRCSG